METSHEIVTFRILELFAAVLLGAFKTVVKNACNKNIFKCLAKINGDVWYFPFLTFSHQNIRLITIFIKKKLI